VRGIRSILDARKKAKTLLPIVQIQFTLTYENQRNILETAEYLQQKLPVDVFGVVPGVFTTEALNQATTRMYKEEFNIEQKYWKALLEM